MPAPIVVETSPRNRKLELGGPLLIYAAIALLVFDQGSHWSTGLLGNGVDRLCFVWFLHWWPYAIWHGLNPFITKFVWYPHGFNLAWATSVPLAALIMTPVTFLLGPVFSYNVLSVFAPALAAWTAFLLCEDVTEDWPASVFGGYLFGFSSYELGQMVGHLSLNFICLIPLVVLVCIRRVRGDMSSRKFVVLLAACLLAEMGLATEILATLCVFGAVAWVVFFLFAPRGQHVKLFRMAMEVVAAAVLTVVLASPFLYFLMKGMVDVPRQINFVQDYVTDPRNFFVPTAVTRLSNAYFQNIANQFDGNGSEQGAYLGAPLIVMVGLFFISQIRRAYVMPLLATTVILAIFSLGPYLQIGRVPSQHALPWLLTEYVPMLNAVLPSRFSMYVALSTAIAAALALAAAQGWWRWLNYGLAVAACVCLWPNSEMYAWSPFPVQPFFTAANVAKVLGKMPNVLVLPFGQTGPGMAWQLDARMSFTQAGGYIGFTPFHEEEYPAFAELFTGLPGQAFNNDLMSLCVRHHVQDILLEAATPKALQTAILGLGWPSHVDHGVTVVQVPAASMLDYYAITGDYWSSPATFNWMGKQLEIVTHKFPLHLTLSGAWTPPSSNLKVTLADGGDTETYAVTPATVIPVVIPANSAALITANQTFVPAEILHNGDPRQLSVMVSVDAPAAH